MEKKPATIKPVSFAYSEDKQENKAGYNKGSSLNRTIYEIVYCLYTGFIPSVQSVHSRPVDLTDSTSFYRPSFMTSSACMKKKPVPLPERLVDNDASRFQVGHQTKKVQRQYMEIEVSYMIHTHTRLFTHTHTHTRLFTHTHTHTYTRLFTHTHTHTHNSIYYGPKLLIFLMEGLNYEHSRLY